MKKKILISINPEHVQNIINGIKKYEYIEKEYGSGIASEEIMFLAIHIKRVCMAG